MAMIIINLCDVTTCIINFSAAFSHTCFAACILEWQCILLTTVASCPIQNRMHSYWGEPERAPHWRVIDCPRMHACGVVLRMRRGRFHYPNFVDVSRS